MIRPLVLAAIRALLAAFLLSMAAIASAAQCVWTGAASASWALPSNWSCPNGPQDGDVLEFPDGASNMAMVDDIASLTASTLSFTGTTGGYTLTGGGALGLSGATAIVSRAKGQAVNKIALASPLTLGAPLALIDNNTGAGGKLQIDAPVNLNGSTMTVTWNGAQSVVVINGVIAGSGGISMSGPGAGYALVLAGNNTFSGPVNVTQGYLLVSHANGLGAGGSAADGTTVGPDGTLVLGADIADEFLSLNAGSGANGNGNMQADAGTRIFGGPVTLLGGSPVTSSFNIFTRQVVFTGPITGVGGVYCCNGINGTLAFTSSQSTFSGPTRLDLGGGTLVLMADGALSPNSALVLGGQAGSLLDMGAYGATAASLAGTSNSTLKIAAGKTLQVNGNVVLNDMKLQLSVSGNPAAGTVFKIVDKTGAGAVNGTFGGIAEGGTAFAGGLQFAISYMGGNGNDVTATVIGPAPQVTVSVSKPGSGTGSVTGGAGAIACGLSCSVNVSAGTQVLLAAQADAGSTFTGWTGPCTGTGLCSFIATADTQVTATFASGTMGKVLDIDGNDAYDALTDGLLVVRYLFGLPDSALVVNAIGAGATRSAGPAVRAYLDDVRPLLDVDGNGAADALTDGLMVMRYLFGLGDAAIAANAIAKNATRTTPFANRTYLDTLKP